MLQPATTRYLRRLMLALVCAAVPCSAALPADVLIVQNRDADTILSVYAAPAAVSGWGPNRLRSAIPPGEYAEIDLRIFGDRVCLFDIFIEDDDGGTTEYTNIDLCESPYVTY